MKQVNMGRLVHASAQEETARCLLCHHAPCSKVCSFGDPARFIRALRFENEYSALSTLPKCSSCEVAVCEEACVKVSSPIRIVDLCAYAKRTLVDKQSASADLSIDFCGVHCDNPFFLSSSVVASNYEMCARALEMGWAGIVFKTIGMLRPKEVSPRFGTLKKEGLPFIGFRNLEQIAEHTLEENLEFMRRIKADFPNKVLVASIMGQSDEEWTELSRLVTEVGADIIECNFSCPHMSDESLGSDVGQNPAMVKRFTKMVRKGTHLPILAKMTPNLGNMETPAIAAIKAGADGIAAINTIKSITGVDLEEMTGTPSIAGKSSVSGYSGKAVKPIALRFIHDLAVYPELAGIPISGMGGIENWRDAAEFIMLGCSNIQITTAVMQYGYRIIDDLIEGLSGFMVENRYKHVADMVGKALGQMVSTENLDRDTVSYPRFDRDKCVGCGRCFISCMDAGHQAIRWDEENRRPILAAKSCVGCHLCLHVCQNDAITASKRVPKPQ